MKKNLPLYILLIFLIIVNCFFLYNYLGIGEKDVKPQPKRPADFLVEQLGFNETQQEQFVELVEVHHHRMRSMSKDVRALKDELFKGLSDESLIDVNIDSITSLIGEKEVAINLEIFNHFKQVQELCNDEQKEKFSKIIEDALRRGAREQGPPRGEGRDGNRPPRPDGPRGDRPPPPEH